MKWETDAYGVAPGRIEIDDRIGVLYGLTFRFEAMRWSEDKTGVDTQAMKLRFGRYVIVRWALHSDRAWSPLALTSPFSLRRRRQHYKSGIACKETLCRRRWRDETLMPCVCAKSNVS
jgi:hypothetical protein